MTIKITDISHYNPRHRVALAIEGIIHAANLLEECSDSELLEIAGLPKFLAATANYCDAMHGRIKEAVDKKYCEVV